jgi:uncharacterized DUF497 family protein
MQGDDFEWDDAKAALNVRKHGVGFPAAQAVFRDPRLRSSGSMTVAVMMRTVSSSSEWSSIA